jgi:hypothetical protein
MNELHYGDSGSYIFDKPFPQPESAQAVHEEKPTVSLYNLLDHSPKDLEVLLDSLSRMEQSVHPFKLSSLGELYSTVVAWMRIIEGAIKERKYRDSEAWADKTAKEINEQTK